MEQCGSVCRSTTRPLHHPRWRALCDTGLWLKVINELELFYVDEILFFKGVRSLAQQYKLDKRWYNEVIYTTDFLPFYFWQIEEGWCDITSIKDVEKSRWYWYRINNNFYPKAKSWYHHERGKRV